MQSEDVLMLLDNQAWRDAPDETGPLYSRTWKHVSVALQKALRRWTLEIYFRDGARFANRDDAFPMVVYAAARVFHGRTKTEFTYDLADPRTLDAAVRAIGQPIQNILKPMAERLKRSGQVTLGWRYAPVWHRDVLAAVRKRPKRLVALLAREAKIIDAVIDLGTSRDAAAAFRCAKTANATLRNMLPYGCGEDMRELLGAVLDEATAVLVAERRPGRGGDSGENVIDIGVFENAHAIAARSPDLGVG
jgi:hypothetical protein